MSAPRTTPRSARRLDVDVLRGVAVLIMILWHVADAWTESGQRAGRAFQHVVFIGGWAAPMFLFLAGVSVALASQSDRSGRANTARGWRVLGLAFVFRLQSFLLNPAASWSSLLKPDILNILGIGIAAVIACLHRAGNRGRTVMALWLIGPAAAVVLIAPWSREWQWPDRVGVHLPALQGYIRPIASVGGFSLIPWIAFVFAGAYAGARLGAPRSAAAEPRFQTMLAACGVAIFAAGWLGMSLPPLRSSSSFWTTSLSFFLLRLGVLIALMPVAWLWIRLWPPRSDRHPMIVLGRTSLFVYWVHVEVAYGFASHPLHRALTLPQALAGSAALAGLMYVVALAWMRRRRPIIPIELRAPISR